MSHRSSACFAQLIVLDADEDDQCREHVADDPRCGAGDGTFSQREVVGVDWGHTHWTRDRPKSVSTG